LEYILERVNPVLRWYKKQGITIRAAIIGGAFAIVAAVIASISELLRPNPPIIVYFPTAPTVQSVSLTQIATASLPPNAISSLNPKTAIVEKPVLSSPANGIGMPQKTDITLVWNPSKGAVQYRVEVWGGPYNIMTPCTWQESTICHIGQMHPGIMFWRVIARDDKGQASQWSETWSFQIGMIPGYVDLVDDLRLSTPAGNWPPQRGDKLIAHIRIRNGGDQPLQLTHVGVKGRRNGDEFWDIGFWSITLNGDQSWNFDANNERPLEPGEYAFQLVYSLDGTTWVLLGSEYQFTVP
jgi:hypothetical protein